MTKYIKDKTGKFAGSIGDGKTNIPTAPDALLKAGELIDADNTAYAQGLNDLSDGLGQVAEAWNNFERAARENHEARVAMNERHRHEYEAIVERQDRELEALKQKHALHDLDTAPEAVEREDHSHLATSTYRTRRGTWKPLPDQPKRTLWQRITGR